MVDEIPIVFDVFFQKSLDFAVTEKHRRQLKHSSTCLVFIDRRTFHTLRIASQCSSLYSFSTISSHSKRT